MFCFFISKSFSYCIQSDEEGNISSDSNSESNTDEKTSTENEITSAESKTPEESNQNTIEIIEKDTGQKRSITPEPRKENENNPTTILLETPKMNMINCTNDKENKSTQKINKQLLTLCHQSDVVITSFSPRETGVRIEKSFATIIKPTVLVTKPPTTPKSVYSTPKGEINQDNSMNLINFYTPSTSKKAAGPTFSSTASKVLKNSSMHLIDLTTPNKLRPASPCLKSTLKSSSVKKNVLINMLPSTPAINDTQNSPLDSIISVSSTDTTGVIEVTSDASNIGITPVSGLTTPKKITSKNIVVSTPKRTPQSLMKRALLTSAKKQTTTPQTSIGTPRRNSVNRIPLRSALLRTPITPQAANTEKNSAQLSRRLSMSTPTRINASKRIQLDNTPSTSRTAIDSSRSATRRSSLNSISAHRDLSTSTPVSASGNNTGLRTRAACKTSPLHKVRKSISGIPLSSHISKARKTILMPASTSKLTSLKQKSPQQIMSNRLVSRARKSLCISPITTRSRTMVAESNTSILSTCPFSIIKNGTQSPRTTAEIRKEVLFDHQQPIECGEVDDLSQTYIIDSDEEDKIDKAEKDKAKDATFSPIKDNAVVSIKTVQDDTTVMQKEQNAFEVPLDVEELTHKQNENEEINIENKELDKEIVQVNVDTVDKEQSVVAEESFAEIINAPPIVDHEKSNLSESIEVFNSPEESSQTESQRNFAETSNVEPTKVSTADNSTESSIRSKGKETEVLESGFGEESFVLVMESSKTEDTDDVATAKTDVQTSLDANKQDGKDEPDKSSLVNSAIEINEVVVESTIDVTELASKESVFQTDTTENNNTEVESSQIEYPVRAEPETFGDDESRVCTKDSAGNANTSETGKRDEEDNRVEIEENSQNGTESICKSTQQAIDIETVPHQYESESIDISPALDDGSTKNATCSGAIGEDNEAENSFKDESETLSKIGEVTEIENKVVLHDSEEYKSVQEPESSKSVSMLETANESSECNLPEAIIESIEKNKTLVVCDPVIESKQLCMESTDSTTIPDNSVEINEETNAFENKNDAYSKSTSGSEVCEIESEKNEFISISIVEDAAATSIQTSSRDSNKVHSDAMVDNDNEAPSIGKNNEEDVVETISETTLKNDIQQENILQNEPDLVIQLMNESELCEIESFNNKKVNLGSLVVSDNNVSTTDSNDVNIMSISQSVVENTSIVPALQNLSDQNVDEFEKTDREFSPIVDNREYPSKDEKINEIENKIEDLKPSEYKPIYEDITLESSLIEKELPQVTTDNTESKQPLYEDITLEGSVIEKNIENIEALENENNSKDKAIDDFFKLNKKPEDYASTRRENLSIIHGDFQVNDRSDEVITPKVADDSLENTNKLLEEIENVLNKSDEIKQKHLNELEENLEASEDKKPPNSSGNAGKTATENEVKIIKELTAIEGIDSHETENKKNKIETELSHPEFQTAAIENLNYNEKETKETIKVDLIETNTNKEPTEPTETIANTEIKNSEFDLKEQSSECNENSEEKQEVPTQITMANSTCLTPQRKSRRSASQSADTPQTCTEAVFTPRRSARRASMSAETNNTSTPTRKSTRRASLSAISETISTPKMLTRRRTASMSMDEEVTKPAVTCRTTRVRTPQKQIKQQTIIREELDQVITSTIIEEEADDVIVEHVNIAETNAKDVLVEGQQTVETEKAGTSKTNAIDSDANLENFEEKISENNSTNQEEKMQIEKVESISQEISDSIATEREILNIKTVSKDANVEATEVKESFYNPLEEVISSTTDNLTVNNIEENEIENSFTQNIGTANDAIEHKGKLISRSF